VLLCREKVPARFGRQRQNASLSAEINGHRGSSADQRGVTLFRENRETLFVAACRSEHSHQCESRICARFRGDDAFTLDCSHKREMIAVNIIQRDIRRA
jgi:hypothetical protein